LPNPTIVYFKREVETKGVACLVTLTLLLLLMTMIFAASASNLTVEAQQVAPGVYPGASFTYGTPDGSSWVAMNPSTAPPPAQWEKFENLSTINFTIIKNSNSSAVPEFAPFMLLPLFMIITLLGAIAFRRKRDLKKPRAR
jgi:predicted PurR-regulated permease PerM